ncbi:MAG: hypothetical protein PHD25_12445 [Bacteroidales bacterium]|nr:hypothetical protein [Bacteroidales bacterium]
MTSFKPTPCFRESDFRFSGRSLTDGNITKSAGLPGGTTNLL